MTSTGLYAVKCDDCKTEIRRTDSVRESAAGGRCEECQTAVEKWRAEFASRWNSPPEPKGGRIHRKGRQTDPGEPCPLCRGNRRDCPGCDGAGFRQPGKEEGEPGRRVASELAARARCDLGVGCDEAGVCYATAHGRPEKCPVGATGHRDGEVWRDGSPPAFTAEAPAGTHPAWFYTISGRDWGPYYTRSDAEKALSGWGHAAAVKERAGRRLSEAVAVTDLNPTGDEELE